MFKQTICFFFILFSSFGFSQRNFSLETGGRVGILVPHRPAMKHLPQEIVKGVDISFSKQVSGQKSWHKIYNSPNIGLSFYHSTLGNYAVLGKATGITSMIDFPFVNNDHFLFGLNLKLGLGYVSNPFDLITNPDNIALSSHVNCLALGGLHFQYTFNRFFLGTRFELTHLSNAALKAPNLGVNMFQTSLQIGYLFAKNKLNLNLTKEVSPIVVSNLKSNYIYILGFVGQKQIFNHLGTNYPVQGGTLLFQHLFSLPVGVEIGFDLMHNSSDLQLLADKNIYTTNILKSGGYLAYILTLDKLHLIIGMGGYIHDNYNLNDKIYHRIGMRYTLLNRFVINCTLKTHWGNADYLELGVGMRFGFKKMLNYSKS
jgi:hypothetical protein